jgi:hypothetical protein
VDYDANAHPAPDPILLTQKAAINWPKQHTQQLLVTAAEPLDEDEDDDDADLDAQAEAEFLFHRQQMQQQAIIGMDVFCESSDARKLVIAA